jgi:phenylacetate-CoA ligase
MRLWCFLRYLIARLTFFALRLPVSRFEREVSELWRLTPEERKKRLDETLKSNSPRGENGERVSSVAQLDDQRPLTKSAFRESTSNAPKTASGFSRHTAGTTGDPTHVLLSREELARMLAVRSYCYRHHGIRLGQREARIWGRAEDTTAARVRDFLLNRKVFYPAESDVENIVLKLANWRPEYIYGYTSLILEAAQVAKSKKIRIDGLKAVVCTAEAILPAQKRYISEAFRAPVLEEYGSTEFDVIAFECRSGHLHLVNPWLWVEAEDETVLITDVARESQNLVRYQLGDVLEIGDSRCDRLGNNQVVHDLKGRTSNQFAYFGLKYKFHAVVFGRMFDRYMAEFEDCFKFHVTQIDPYSFVIFLSVMPKKGGLHLTSWIESYCLDYFGDVIGEKVRFSLSSEVLKRSRDKHTYFSLDFDPVNYSGLCNEV